MALSNAYFGTTLTDAQRAASGAAQMELDGDVARRNYLAQIMQAMNQRQRLAQQDRQFGQEMGMRGQESQANTLLRALALQQQQMGREQDAWMHRDSLANQVDLARIQYPKERWNQDGDREAAERLRQEGMFKQQQALLDDEIDTHNTAAEAAATRYNALLQSLTDEKDTAFTARSTAQQKAWRELLDAIKVGGDDKLLKPEVSVDAATKEIQYKFSPVLRKPRASARPTASGPTMDSAAIIEEAKRAIAAGADPTAVTNRLAEKYNLQLGGNARPPYDPSIQSPFGGAPAPVRENPYATAATMGTVNPNMGLMLLMRALAMGGGKTGAQPGPAGPAGMYPPMNQATQAPQGGVMPIPGENQAWQPNQPSLVDLIQQLQSYSGQ